LRAGGDWATIRGWIGSFCGEERVGSGFFGSAIIKTMAHALAGTLAFNFEKVLPLIRTTRSCRQNKMGKNKKYKK